MHDTYFRLAALVLLALALIGCGAPSAAVPPQSGPTVAPTPAPTATLSLTAARPSATPTAPPGSTIVTLADNGQTITMRVGERFLLNLGGGIETYDWQAVPADPSVVSRVPNVLTIRGSQGLYEAHRPGQTELTATGDPICRQSQPSCAAPSRRFSVDVAVEP